MHYLEELNKKNKIADFFKLMAIRIYFKKFAPFFIDRKCGTNYLWYNFTY